jgi:hypothetical protein
MTLTGGVENKTREVGTEIRLKLIPRKGNVVLGCFKERLSATQTKLRLEFDESQAKLSASQISIGRIPINLSGQKFESVCPKVISSLVRPRLLIVVKI